MPVRKPILKETKGRKQVAGTTMMRQWGASKLEHAVAREDQLLLPYCPPIRHRYLGSVLKSRSGPMPRMPRVPPIELMSVLTR